MLNSLRSRLLASYLLIIVAVVVLMVGALVASAVLTNSRSFQAAVELNAVARPVLVQLVQAARDAERPTDELGGSIDAIADEFNVRIVWVAEQQRRVLYDSGGEWDERIVPDALVPRTSSNVLDAVEVLEWEDGRRWVFYTPPTGRIGRTFIILAKPEPARFSFFNGVFAQPVGRSLVASIVLAGVLALVIARSVAKPLQRVAAATDAVANGDYDQTVPIEGPSEVREVATTFNQMTQRVRASQQSQRDFVANVSHDLKTPITSIQGWSQALLDGTADGEMVTKSAEIIHTEANRMSRMVQELLDLARIESGTFELKRSDFLLADLFSRVRDSFLPQAQAKGVALTTQVASDLVISADADRLAQVLTNLIDNALMHTAADGVVRLTAQQDAARTLITVADTGSGIALEQLDRIFERFYQTDKARAHGRRGTGLGLAIVKELVEAHGGEISAESRPGHGTTFTIKM